ncbi:MAG: dephospho-CoA kinase [Saprospiraceae bacterium]|nr:dephospho-CoA kinase [Saprospiraceae bacterium]
MLKIGITGGIGSGKSTVCHLFEKYNVPVYYADDRAKWLMNNKEELKEKLKITFGELVYDSEENLDRKYLAEIVFNDKQKLEILNSIVHPAVYEDSKEWQVEQQSLGVSYTLKEAALLFEAGSYLALDKIIVVTAPEDVRIKRVMARDKVSREAVLARISKQMPQSKKEELADFVITNLEWESIDIQVSKTHRKLIELSKRINI